MWLMKCQNYLISNQIFNRAKSQKIPANKCDENVVICYNNK